MRLIAIRQLLFSAPFISLGVVWLVCALCLAWVFWPLGDWLRYPLVYHGDGLWNLFVVKTVIETGWYSSNPNLGAPFAATFLDFPKPESLYLLLFRLGGMVTDNVPLLHNLFYFLGFFLVGAIALLVLRSGFRLHWIWAVVGALLYAFLPFHFMRQSSLFLSNYFVIPIIVWLALLISSACPPFFAQGRLGAAKWTTWLAAALIASTSIYYAFFALCIIGAVGCLESIRTRLWRHSMSAVLVCSLIVVFVGCNLVPSLLYRAEHGANGQVASRPLIESDIFALRPLQLLLPPKVHRFSPLAELTRQYEAGAQYVNENRSSYLGILGGVGFLILLVTLVSGHRIVQAIPSFGTAARINVTALCISIVGGGGLFIGLVWSPQFRALNRISVLIAFVSIAGLMLILERLGKCIPSRLSRPVLLSTSTILVGFGMCDQIPTNARPDISALVSEYESDRTFVHSVEARLPDGARILQLPYTPFPEVPPRFKESVYSHIRGYLHGTKLRWSYGGMKGRASDAWLGSLDQFPLAEQLKIAQSSGFRGIWLDRRAFTDGGIMIEDGLRSLGIGRMHESANKMLVFYPLSPTGELPLHLLPPPILGAGFYQWEGSGEAKWVWTSGNAILILLNNEERPRRAQLSLTLSSLTERSVKIMHGANRLRAFELHPNSHENVEIELNLSQGKTEIRFITSQPPVVQNSRDQRQLAMVLGNVRLVPLK